MSLKRRLEDKNHVENERMSLREVLGDKILSKIEETVRKKGS
ncbi:hypothetical protein JOC76_001537 [Neobacillus cucumis]|nr:hypothetical protein [Neobacillus cucumis]